MFGDGICTIRNSGVNVNTFLARVNPKDGGHSAWRFSPGQLRLNRGTTLQLNSLGGETHTFTEVVNFGGGIIPLCSMACSHPARRWPSRSVI